MPEFLGFAKSNVIATARLAWNNSKLTEFNYTGFEEDWYPAVWMIFFLYQLVNTVVRIGNRSMEGRC